MDRKDGKEVARELTDFVNWSYADQDEKFVKEIMTSHRTLQQNTFRLMIKCIKAWAETERYDPRNEPTVLTCKKIVKEFEEELLYLPYI